MNLFPCGENKSWPFFAYGQLICLRRRASCDAVGFFKTSGRIPFSQHG